jgi:hypothetical protein
MATIEHSALTTGELHEPKGIATANPNSVYVADGAGSGQWRQAPTGFLNYVTSGTGTTITTPTAFTLVNVASLTNGTQRQYTHNGAGRLTYTGATTLSTKINATIVGQTSASDVLVVAQIFVNGIPAFPSQFVAEQTVQGSNGVVTLPMIGYVDLSTNDYVEVFVQTDTGNIEVFGLNLLAEGVI